MEYKKFIALCFVTLTLGEAFALPQHPVYKADNHPAQVREERKFEKKPNAMKKGTFDDLDDIGSNSIQEKEEDGPTAFSWSTVIGGLMQLLLGQGGGAFVSPSKNDIEDGVSSTWSHFLTVGLRVLSAILGGAQQQGDGIDKIDNPSSPMQALLGVVLGALLGQGRNPEQVNTMAKQASEFINIVMNLLEALKTSFSHRSLSARSLGKRDSVSEAAVASISMIKGYMRSMKSYSYGKNEEEGHRGCAERALCEANAECVADSQGASPIFCQLGSYAASYFIQTQGGIRFEALYEAGRRGRSGEDCRTIFMDCNAV